MIKKFIDAIAFLILGLAGLVVMYGFFAFLVVAWIWLDDRALLRQAGLGLVVVCWAAYHVFRMLREPEAEDSSESGSA